VTGADNGGTGTVFGLTDKTIIVFLVLQVSENLKDNGLIALRIPGR